MANVDIFSKRMSSSRESLYLCSIFFCFVFFVLTSASHINATYSPIITLEQIFQRGKVKSSVDMHIDRMTSWGGLLETEVVPVVLEYVSA